MVKSEYTRLSRTYVDVFEFGQYAHTGCGYEHYKWRELVRS